MGGGLLWVVGNCSCAPMLYYMAWCVVACVLVTHTCTCIYIVTAWTWITLVDGGNCSRTISELDNMGMSGAGTCTCMVQCRIITDTPDHV